MPGRSSIILAIAGLALINGLFNPLLLPQTSAAIILLAPGLLLRSAPLVAFLAYLLGAGVTVVLAGLPAALFERLAGHDHTTYGSYLVWLCATAILSLPAAAFAAALLLR